MILSATAALTDIWVDVADSISAHDILGAAV